MKRVRAIAILACMALSSVCAEASDMVFGAVPIKIGGFLSMYGNVTDMKTPYLRFAQATDRVDFTNETTLGLQFDAEINEKVHFISQVVADRYLDDYSVNADWAFLRFSINDSIDMRAGKLGLPAFLYSDYVNVRYAYTWARVPSETYEMIPLSSFNGIDFLVQIPIQDYTLILQPFLGNTTLTSPFGFGGEVTTHIEDLLGLAVTLDAEMHVFRVSYFGSKVTMTDPSLLINLDQFLTQVVGVGLPSVPLSELVDSLNLEFYSVSYLLSYDRFEFITEWSKRLTPNTLIATFNGSFMSFAYQFDTYKPYLLLATLDTRNAASRPQEQESVTVGVRIDLYDNTSLKIEWQRAFIDVDSSTDANRGLFALSSGSSGETLDGVNLLTVGFDAAF